MADKPAEQLSAPVEMNMNSAASQLSAMIDGELSDRESELALRRLGRDRDLQGRWERYHLISDTLQGHLPVSMDAGFAERIRLAIEAEPLPQPAMRPLPAWYKPVTGFALAASVVLVALFGLRLSQTDATLAPVETAAVSRPAVMAVAAAPVARPVQIAAIDQPASNDADAGVPIDARLNSYLVSHNGYASMNSMHGMLPYVRMVGYQTNR